jgi:hypothetical protein
LGAGLDIGDGQVPVDMEGIDETPSADPPYMEDSPVGSPVAAEPTPTTRKRPRATVEEVEDEDERFVEDFPDDLHAGEPLEQCKTFFENLREEQKAAGNAPWYPFESEDEWELARWLMTSGLSQKKTDAYLKLNAVRTFAELAFSCC